MDVSFPFAFIKRRGNKTLCTAPIFVFISQRKYLVNVKVL